jgi:hypothetical protein
MMVTTVRLDVTSAVDQQNAETEADRQTHLQWPICKSLPVIADRDQQKS